MASEEDENKCPLCPAAGPPSHPTHTAAGVVLTHNGNGDAIQNNNDNDDTALAWIECTKCKEWYHGVCVILNSEEDRCTVPEQVRKYMVEHSDDGDWTDWTSWVDRWFCSKCVARSKDPSNPHRPHHPMKATLDHKTFPPKSRINLKRSPSSSSVNQSSNYSTTRKRRIISDGTMSNGQGRMSVDVSGSPADGIGSPSAGGPSGQSREDDGSSMNRPKRQVAKNRPDYHALHHHIATPTAKWLELISDPDKYGADITVGNFPRIPGHLLSRAWVDSPVKYRTGPVPRASSQDIKSTSPLSPDPDNKSPAPTSVDYPPHLPPTLFYGNLREPLIITPEDGGFASLGGKLPSKDLTVADVARLVGPEHMVDVIDVATQSSSQWPLRKWADYVASLSSPKFSSSSSEPVPLTKVYNVISLEISGSELAKRVRPPRIVSEIDWVDNFWHFGPGGKAAAIADDLGIKLEEAKHVNGNAEAVDGKGVKTERKGKAKEWPKVQLYCLMGAKGSWTDWHVDFAASSVYYTIHKGAKTFFFIRPTEKNLAAYAEWSGSSEKQESVWLGNMCDDEVRKVTLRQGDTMIIPAGYIHAVHTPEDSIVFGGNFLHSYDIPAQLRLRQIEIDTKVPQRFRFPQFDKLCWYVADRYCSELRQLRAYRLRTTVAPNPAPPPVVLHGLLALANFLLEQVNIMENPETEENRRNLIHGRIPIAVVKDPSGLARELKWRIERELPDLVQTREDRWESEEPKNGQKKGSSRPRLKTSLLPPKPTSRVRNFGPSPWDTKSYPVEITTTKVSLPCPNIGSSAIKMEPEDVEKTTTVNHQLRSRSRYLGDGSVVVEEQESVYTQRVITWGPRGEIKEEKMDGEVKVATLMSAT